MNTSSDINITGVEVVSVNVPMPIPHRTASGALTHASLVLVDLLTNAGITGRSYVFTYTPLALGATAQLVKRMESLLVGHALAPLAIERRLDARHRLLGTQGLVMMAMAAIDMAAWDALAQAAGMPLVRLLGGERRPSRAYSSHGMDSVDDAVRNAVRSVETGFRALKFKLGGASFRDDLQLVRSLRSAVGEGIDLMVDYNQSLSIPEALRRCRALDDEGLAWIEEPVLHTDLAGHAKIAAQTASPIQLGENWWGTADMAKSIAAGASDLAMPDVMKLGGVSAWLRAAALAHAAGLPVSSHIFPEFSAHLLPVTPTAHYLEVLPLADAILAEPYRVVDGAVEVPDLPGVGLEWNAAAVERYRV
jgi:mandelate racemase